MSDVVSYEMDDGTVVQFEVASGGGFGPAGGSGKALSGLGEAVKPALAGAKVVIDQIQSLAPDEFEVKFGIKVGGETGFLVAKGTAEASYEVTMTWKSELSGS